MTRASLIIYHLGLKFRIVARYTLVFVLFWNCIGVDRIDDPIIGARIEVDKDVVALKKGETAQINAIYYNQYGLAEKASLEWMSANGQVVSVSNGKLTAINSGQTTVAATNGLVTSRSIQVNVVLDASEVAQVLIAPSASQNLKVGESIQFAASARNIDGSALVGKPIEWFSENSFIATVNSGGLVTGRAAGLVDIHAKSNGVKSNIVNVIVGEGRVGTFVSSGGYKAVGTATLKQADGKLMLELSSNFETSFALGTFVYLANTTSGSQVRAAGFEVAQITTGGAKSFNLTALRPEIKITDYNYVVILCKPASVTFGFALLN